MAASAPAIRGGLFGNLAQTTEHGLLIPEDISLEDWLELGRRLGKIVETSAWWIGDWLQAADCREGWGHKYDEAMELTGLDNQTLRAYAYVCGRFDSLIRINNLSFAHHRIVASLPPPEAAAQLKLADENDWSVSELREHALRGGHLPPPSSSPPTTPAAPLTPTAKHPDLFQITTHATAEESVAWDAAAGRAGLKLADWIHTVCNEAA